MGTCGVKRLCSKLWKCDMYCFKCFVCDLGGSDNGSLSGSDGEEQKLWEETQIGKGVKRCPGERVGKDCGRCPMLHLTYFTINIITFK